MSSTGKCFDIGKSTRDAITLFEKRWQDARARINQQNKKPDELDFEIMVERETRMGKNGLKLGTSDSAGNGPLMRLAPIPCFFSDSYEAVLQHIDEATELTHGDQRAIDACRFYAGLIWHALNDTSKEQLLDRNFYRTTLKLKLHDDVRQIAEGSYKDKKKGYEDGIRGKGYIVNSLEAALWAFANDEDKFDKGVLLAVNLGDDTDTTAAIYGELAGAVYGIDKIRQEWIDQLFQGEFIKTIAKGLYIKGEKSRRTPQESDRSGETNKTRDGSKASGPSKKQHNQRSGGTDNTSDPSQNTDKDGTSDTAYSGGKSNTNDPSSNGGRRYVFSE
jgi:ADP-ribosylglycohydrolase